jgi:hypothetical protein
MARFGILFVVGILGIAIYFLMAYAIPLIEALNVVITRSQRVQIIQYTLIGQLTLTPVLVVLGLISNFVLKKDGISSIGRTICLIIYCIPAISLACLFGIAIYSAWH